jgi:hypothetical protein
MALIIKDRIKEGTTTTGTGDITLAGTAATFKTFSSALSDGDTTYYAIAHTASGVDEWEVGIGTYTVATNSISRDTIIEGSNASSPVNLSAGVKNIFITYPSNKAVYVDTSGRVQPTTTLMNTIKANDGAGSTLDADLLDGQHGFYYTNYVNTAISNLVNTAPATLDTLNELAAALGDDPNFATTVTNSIATKLPLAGGTMTGDLSFGDNNKAIFGAGSDLQIYHTGSHSYIEDNGTGNLYIDGAASVVIRGDTANTISAIFNDAGSVVLKHNGNTKLDTTATGISVTGTVVADGLTVDGDLAVSSANSRIRLFETDATDLNTQLQNSAGDFNISTLVDDAASSTLRLKLDHATGDISFYEDLGVTAKFFWDASAESLGIGITRQPLTACFIYKV